MTREERLAKLQFMDRFVEHLEKAGSLKDAGLDSIGEPGVLIMQIEHDNSCPILQGGERCTCNSTHRFMKVETTAA